MNIFSEEITCKSCGRMPTTNNRLAYANLLHGFICEKCMGDSIENGTE